MHLPDQRKQPGLDQRPANGWVELGVVARGVSMAWTREKWTRYQTGRFAMTAVEEALKRPS